MAARGQPSTSRHLGLAELCLGARRGASSMIGLCGPRLWNPAMTDTS
jgi:hypothetical protein